MGIKKLFLTMYCHSFVDLNPEQIIRRYEKTDQLFFNNLWTCSDFICHFLY